MTCSFPSLSRISCATLSRTARAFLASHSKSCEESVTVVRAGPQQPHVSDTFKNCEGLCGTFDKSASCDLR